jgi:hypothetical protein
MTRTLIALVLAIGCSSGGKGKPVLTPDAAPEEDAAPVVTDTARRDSAPDLAADVASFPRRPSCTAVTTPLKNGDFEMPPEGTTIPGWTMERTGAGTVGWELVSGFAGSSGIGFRVPDDRSGSGAVARQTLALDPFTSYTLRARIAADAIRPRGDGVLLFLVTARNGDRTWSIGPRKQDRTDLDYGTYSMEFATGAQGQVDIELRTSAAGHYLVDEIILGCNERAQRFEGKSLVLTLYDDQVTAGTPPNIDAVVANLDRVVGAYADLTGVTPSAARISSFPLRFAVITEARGDPALWNTGVTPAQWAAAGFVPSSLSAALARNFDRPAWIFDDDFAELAFYYALETLDLRVGTNDTTDRGTGYRMRLEQRYKDNFQPGRCADGGGLVFKDLLIRDQIGWEPFKATFRALAALPAASVPASRWERLKRFHDKLAELSGKDIWAMFTPQDRAALEAHYNVPALETPRRVGELPLATLAASLATAEWESAMVGRDRPTRNRLGNDCPMITAAGPQATGLFAYPFSQYVFRLNKTWKRLTAGYTLQAGQMGSVVFIVRGDGRELHRSLVVKDSMARPLDVDVTGVDRLELLVTDGGDGNAADYGLWLDPRVTR